jgi:predicted DNA-binding ribbon-helix-helix protein
MLCDAFLRNTHNLFKDISADERHNIFVLMSKLKDSRSDVAGLASLVRNNWIESKSERKDIISCSSLSGPLANKDEAVKLAALCASLSEKGPGPGPEHIELEDLYG